MFAQASEAHNERERARKEQEALDLKGRKSPRKGTASEEGGSLKPKRPTTGTP